MSIQTIPQFYKNKNVLITGATGFVGRLLVEKLLRSCPGIDKIYVLVRPKKAKNVQERITDIIDIPLFDKIRNENILALEKIRVLGGDTDQVNCGLTEEDKATIIENVTIIFHCAASVRFDDHLKKAILSNTRGAREMVLLALQLKKIDVFVDTSTAYCNSDRSIVEEKLYPAKIDWKDAISLAEDCDEKTLESLTQKFIYPMPNTYTFTKALGEHAVVELSKDKIPAVIVRPSIVTATYSEPMPGWVDNLNGPSAMIYGVGKGLIRAYYADDQILLDNVFADNLAKVLISSAWKKALSTDRSKVAIYNVTSDLYYSLEDILTTGEAIKYIHGNPSHLYLWPPSLQFYSSFYKFYFFFMLTHFLPALIIDAILLLVKKKPMYFVPICTIVFMEHEKEWIILQFVVHICLIASYPLIYSNINLGTTLKLKNLFEQFGKLLNQVHARIILGSGVGLISYVIRGNLFPPIKLSMLLLKIQSKIYKAQMSLSYFSFNEWTFVTTNYLLLRKSILEEDKKAFYITHFDLEHSRKNFKHFVTDYFDGVKTYIANESPATEDMVKKCNRLLFVEKIWKIFWLCVAVYYIFVKYFYYIVYN